MLLMLLHAAGLFWPPLYACHCEAAKRLKQSRFLRLLRRSFGAPRNDYRSFLSLSDTRLDISIYKILQIGHSPSYNLAATGIFECKNCSKTGPPTIIPITGKINNIKGKSIFIGAFKANRSAFSNFWRLDSSEITAKT